PEAISHEPTRTTFLANPRAATLAITAAALLAAALAVGRARVKENGVITVLLSITGHVVLLALLLTETANVVTDNDRLLMIATLVLGLYASALIVLGF